MTLKAARVLLVFAAVSLPYVARIPGGAAWFDQYWGNGVGAFLFLQLFHALAWTPLLLASLFFRRPLWIGLSALPSFVFLAYAHATLDLSADAQAAVALVIFPVFALPLSGAGVLAAWLLQKRFDRPVT